MPHRRHVALVLTAILIAPMACGDHEPNLPSSRKRANCGIAGASHATVGSEMAAAGKALGIVAAGSPSQALDAGIPDAGAGLEDANVADVDASTPIGLPDAQTDLDAGMPDAAPNAPKVVAVETLASRLVRAGDTVAVACLTIDDSGRSSVPSHDIAWSLSITPNGSAIAGVTGELTAVRAGEFALACTIPSLGLEDVSPALINVLPGTAVRTTVHVEPAIVMAGANFTASCSAEDAYLNPLGDIAPVLSVSPYAAKNQIQNGIGRFERAGHYSVECALSGATPTPATLEVIPGPAASLEITRAPDRVAYSIGEPIALNRVTSDVFGNIIPDATVSVQSVPPGNQRTDGKFAYSTSGQYRLTATVTSPTLQDAVLTRSVDVLVDDLGPSVSCDSPTHAETLDLVPGGHLTLRGTVTDLAGIKEVRVNGSPTSVDSAGHFAVDLTTRYGINFVELLALDNSDKEATRSCAFLLANHFTPDGSLLRDSVSLRLRSTAIDDESRNDLDSIADMLNVILTGNGLRDAIHDALRVAPILKSGCDQSLLGTCVLSSQITYLDTRIDGPNQAHLALVPNGLASVSRVENLGIKLQVDGKLGDLSYGNAGWIDFDSIEVATTFDIDASSGAPRAHVRPGSTVTSMGHIHTDFPGVEGAVLNLVVQVANDIIADMLARRVQSYVTEHLDSALDGIISGLGISSTSQALPVARLDGGQPIPLTFGSEFVSIAVDPNRMLYGMGTRFSAPIAHTRPTFGAPAAFGIEPLDVSGIEPVGVALYEGIFSQGLHALWRAGYFDASFDASNQALGLPPGMQVSITTQLPPVAELVDNRIRLSLGAVTARLNYPAVLATPVPMTLGARASVNVSLVSQALVFDDFTFDELHLSIDDPHTDALTRSLLEGVVPELLKFVVSNALRETLPVLPIPSLTLPNSLTAYGLPPASAFRIAEPTLALLSPYLVLRGSAEITQ